MSEPHETKLVKVKGRNGAQDKLVLVHPPSGKKAPLGKDEGERKILQIKEQCEKAGNRFTYREV
jgi:hypothetical protein